MPIVRMNGNTLSARNMYFYALGAVAVAVAVRWVLAPLLDDYFPLLLFYIAVAATAWYGGLRPALLASVLGFFAALALFVPTHPDIPLRQIALAQWDDWVRYFVVAIVFAIFGQAKHKALNRAELRSETLQVTLLSIGDGVVVTDTEGHVKSLNPVAEELTGWKQRDAIGLPLEDVFRIVNEETRATVDNPVAKVLEHGRIVALANHTVLIAKDGVERPIDDSAAPIRATDGTLLGVVLIFRDVTQMRAADRALRAAHGELEERVTQRTKQLVESHGFTQALLESLQTGIVACNAQGILTLFNRATRDFHGLPEAPLPPDQWAQHYDLYHADGKTPLAKEEIPLFRALSGERVRDVEMVIAPKNGKALTLCASGQSFYDTEGKQLGAVVSMYDITQSKQAQLALREAHDDLERRVAERTAELDEANLALQKADKRKDEFLATLGHELRNPLAPLRNGLQVMRLAGADAEAVERARAMMERQLSQIIRLVDDLLDVNRISRGTFMLRIERANLADIVHHAIETCAPAIEQHQHRLTVSLPPVPIYLDADAARLSQALCNLLINAAKYTPNGGDIRIEARRVGGNAVITVKDSGVGISHEMLGEIFEMFTQVDRSLETSQSGLGIGLTVVRRLVDMHGGTVEAKSAGLGKGSELIVTLPVAISLAPEFDRSIADAPTANGNGRRILIADDNEDAADSLAMLLNMMGNEARTAPDGLAALAVGAKFEPEIVLLDIGMPKMNGFEAARRIRAEPWGAQLVLIALTGRSQDADRRLSHEAGFDFHLVKPVEPAALERMLAVIPHGA